MSFTSAAPVEGNPPKEDGKESAPSLGAFLAAFLSFVFSTFYFSIRLEIIFKKPKQLVILRVKSHHCVMSEMNVRGKLVRLERHLTLDVRIIHIDKEQKKK